MIHTNLNDLKKDCLSCNRCKLHETRHNVVFGVGPDQAEIMFIGEGPGEQEDLKGEPFVGRAGQLLDEMLYIIGLSRNNCYIANIVKCRPPGNSDPLNEERDACSDWLRSQIRLIHPKLIVCLGRIAAMELIDSDFRITREHGIWEERKGIWFMPTYHPAALLRDEPKKKDSWHDLQLVMEKMKELGIK